MGIKYHYETRETISTTVIQGTNSLNFVIFNYLIKLRPSNGPN